MLYKKAVLKISRYSQEDICVRVSFFTNTYFEWHVRTVAFKKNKNVWKLVDKKSFESFNKIFELHIIKFLNYSNKRLKWQVF